MGEATPLLNVTLGKLNSAINIDMTSNPIMEAGTRMTKQGWVSGNCSIARSTEAMTALCRSILRAPQVALQGVPSISSSEQRIHLTADRPFRIRTCQTNPQ